MAPQRKGEAKARKPRGKISPAHRRALDKIKRLDAVIDKIAETARKMLDTKTTVLKRENTRLEETNRVLSDEVLNLLAEKVEIARERNVLTVQVGELTSQVAHLVSLADYRTEEVEQSISESARLRVKIDDLRKVLNASNSNTLMVVNDLRIAREEILELTN